MEAFRPVVASFLERPFERLIYTKSFFFCLNLLMCWLATSCWRFAKVSDCQALAPKLVDRLVSMTLAIVYYRICRIRHEIKSSNCCNHLRRTFCQSRLHVRSRLQYLLKECCGVWSGNSIRTSVGPCQYHFTRWFRLPPVLCSKMMRTAYMRSSKLSCLFHRTSMANLMYLLKFICVLQTKFSCFGAYLPPSHFTV